MKAVSTLVAVVVAMAISYYMTTRISVEEERIADATTNCAVTTSKVSIGNQSTTTVLSAGIKEWAIIQQPINATNTVSLSIGGTAVSGAGYQLASSSITVGRQELLVGRATLVPTSEAIQAITNLGSSTVNVITCR